MALNHPRTQRQYQEGKPYPLRGQRIWRPPVSAESPCAGRRVVPSPGRQPSRQASRLLTRNMPCSVRCKARHPPGQSLAHALLLKGTRGSLLRRCLRQMLTRRASACCQPRRQRWVLRRLPRRVSQPCCLRSLGMGVGNRGAKPIPTTVRPVHRQAAPRPKARPRPQRAVAYVHTGRPLAMKRSIGKEVLRQDTFSQRWLRDGSGSTRLNALQPEPSTRGRKALKIAAGTSGVSG